MLREFERMTFAKDPSGSGAAAKNQSQEAETPEENAAQPDFESGNTSDRIKILEDKLAQYEAILQKVPPAVMKQAISLMQSSQGPDNSSGPALSGAIIPPSPKATKQQSAILAIGALLASKFPHQAGIPTVLSDLID